MRSFLPKAPRAKTSRAIVAVAILALSGPVAVGVVRAQDKAGGMAAQDEPSQPKQITLTQKSLDELVAAQKQIRDIEAKMPQDAKTPDPKAEKQIEAAVKSNGFASVKDFADASFSVGVVLAGIDPDTGKYVGPEAATKKQIDDVKADKQMPPKEKKEALEELNETLKASNGTEKPIQGNIDLVTANFSKLTEGLKQAD